MGWIEADRYILLRIVRTVDGPGDAVLVLVCCGSESFIRLIGHSASFDFMPVPPIILIHASAFCQWRNSNSCCSHILVFPSFPLSFMLPDTLLPFLTFHCSIRAESITFSIVSYPRADRGLCLPVSFAPSEPPISKLVAPLVSLGAGRSLRDHRAIVSICLLGRFPFNMCTGRWSNPSQGFTEVTCDMII